MLRNFMVQLSNMSGLQVGIGLVGMSSLLAGQGSAQVEVSPSKMLLGMGLIVASQVSSLLPHQPVLCGCDA